MPPGELKILIDKIVEEKWHYGDKILKKIEEFEIKEFDNATKAKILDELFNVQVRMVDDGEKTDSYWVHF